MFWPPQDVQVGRTIRVEIVHTIRNVSFQTGLSLFFLGEALQF